MEEKLTVIAWSSEMEHTKTLISLLLFVAQLSITLSNGQTLTEHPGCFKGATRYKNGSLFQTNLKSALSLLNNVSSTTYFYKTTVGSAPDTVYATFMCSFDLPFSDCNNCVTNATLRLQHHVIVQNYESSCEGYLEASWLDTWCVVHYANRSTFSQLDLTNSFSVCVFPSLNDSELNTTVQRTISRLIDNVTTSTVGPVGYHYFAAGEEIYMTYQRLHGRVQCMPDITAFDCRNCLTAAMYQAISLCQLSIGASCTHTTCWLIYSLYNIDNITAANTSTNSNSSTLSLQHLPSSQITPTSSQLHFTPDIFIYTTVWIVLFVLEVMQR